MIRKRYIGCAAAILLSAAPCLAEEQSLLDIQFGTSYRLAKEQQILDPKAGEDLTPVENMSGETSKVVLKSYRKGFDRKDKRDSDFVFEFLGK